MEGIFEAIGVAAESLRELYLAFGPNWGPVVILLLFTMPVAGTVYRSQAIRAGYKEALTTKEESIQRLADENRAWREYFFQQQGISQEKIDMMLGQSRRWRNER